MANVIDNINTTGENDTRVALTFLDLLNKEFADNDEVLIDKKTGMIYYKKADGTIVPSTESIPTSTLNMLEFSSTINRSTIKPVYPTNPEASMVMMNHLMDTPSTIITNPAQLGNFAFRVSKETNGFFLEVKSRIADVNIVETLISIYNKKNPTATITNNAKLSFSVKYVSATGKESVKSKESDVRLNQNVYVPIDLGSTITELPDISYIEVTLLNVTSSSITQMISSLDYLALPISKTNDGNIIIESFNLGSFVDSMASLPSDINTTISNVYTVSNFISDMISTGGDSKALNSKLPKVIDDISELPTGENMPSMVAFIEEVIMEPGDIM